MAKLTLNDVTSGYASTTLTNANNTLIEAAIENTLSRDGTAPNQMEAPIDMNGNNILNIGTFDATTLSADNLVINGQLVTPSVLATSTLPAQTSHIFQFLQTDGTNSSWQVPDASEVSFTQTGTGAVLRTAQSKFQELNVSVLDFGADPTGVIDSTSAIQATINYVSTRGGGIVFFPAGYYQTTSELLVSNHNVFLVGEASAKMSGISFNTAGAATAIRFQHSTAGILLNCGMRFLSVYSANITHKKIAVDLVDVSNFSMSDVGIAHSYGTWTGAGSVGLRIRGRDNSFVGRTTIVADLPVQVSANPNGASALDHWHFEDLYLVGQLSLATYPLILVDTGVQLNEVIFDGIQPWVGGTNGFVWNDTTSAIISQQLRFENVRWEQQGAANGYLFDIAHNTGIYGLVLNKHSFGNGGVGVRGYKLRNIRNVSISNVYYNATDVALDIDATVKGIVASNCWWKDSSTATITGQKSVYSGIKSNPLATLSDSFAYALTTTTTKQEVRDFWAQGTSVTVANNGTVIIGDGAGGTYPMQGYLYVNTDNNGAAAIYYLRGEFGLTYEVSDPLTTFSNTLGTAGHNIANSGTSYILENKSGASTKYRYFFIGSDSLRY